MITKWTPGPLVVQAFINPETWAVCDPAAYRVLAEIPRSSLYAEGEANATLYAAAPDLYAALLNAVESCPCTLRERESGHRIDCYAPAAQEALAKARGEQI